MLGIKVRREVIELCVLSMKSVILHECEIIHVLCVRLGRSHVTTQQAMLAKFYVTFEILDSLKVRSNLSRGVLPLRV